MLKTSLLRGLNLFSGTIPLSLLKTLTQQRLLSVFYHTISDKTLPHIQHLYSIRNTKLFCNDLDYISKHYTPINLSQLINYIHNGSPLPSNSFFLSFDDGLSECYHVIAPMLKQKGIPATFFLNTDFIDNKGLMFRYKASYLIEKLSHQQGIDPVLKKQFLNYQLSYSNLKKSLLEVRWHQQQLLDDIALLFEIDFEAFLNQQQPYLSTAQIESMISDGFTFGSHSLNHPTYNKLTLEDQIKQTIDCQSIIQEKFDLNYQTFAFPFTDVGVSKAFFDTVLQQHDFQLTFGGAGLKKEKIKGQLQRIGFETAVNTPVKQLIHTEYCYYLIKALFGKNIIYRN